MERKRKLGEQGSGQQMVVGLAKRRKEAQASDDQAEEDAGLPSTSLLDELVRGWSAGPACLLLSEGEQAEDALAWNTDFKVEEDGEQLSADVLAWRQDQPPEAARPERLRRTQWDITSTGAGKYLVCLGRRIREEPGEEIRQQAEKVSLRTSSPADSSAKSALTVQHDSKRQRTGASSAETSSSRGSSSDADRTPKPTAPGKGASGNGIDVAERWFQRWEAMEVPGISPEDIKAHIDLLRSVDWSKTSLGPVASWSTTLLSSLGQALASPFPVLLAWGPDLVSKFSRMQATL